MMFLRGRHLALGLLLPLTSCSSPSGPQPEPEPPAVLLVDDFNEENGRLYRLNYTGFANWEVAGGSVDLVGTPPFDDFLPTTQGMYVDLDGTTKTAGTLRSKTRFDLAPGSYRLTFRMAGMPRPNQPENTMIVSVGDLFRETITLPSYAPLQQFDRTFQVSSRTGAHLQFQHLGGDDYGIFIDDVRFERL